MARRKLEGLRPEAGESLEAFVARGAARDAHAPLDFRPQEGDSLGEYLLRLRILNALTPPDVETLIRRFPADVALTAAELARLESGDVELVTKRRLQVLATLYGVPASWVLQVAEYQVEHYTPPLPATDNMFAHLNARALSAQPLSPEAQRTLQAILDDITAAVQSVSSDPQDQ